MRELRPSQVPPQREALAFSTALHQAQWRLIWERLVLLNPAPALGMPAGRFAPFGEKEVRLQKRSKGLGQISTALRGLGPAKVFQLAMQTFPCSSWILALGLGGSGRRIGRDHGNGRSRPLPRLFRFRSASQRSREPHGDDPTRWVQPQNRGCHQKDQQAALRSLSTAIALGGGAQRKTWLCLDAGILMGEAAGCVPQLRKICYFGINQRYLIPIHWLEKGLLVRYLLMQEWSRNNFRKKN